MRKTETTSTPKFEAAFLKYSSMLTKEYRDMFKKVEYAGNNKKDKTRDAQRKGNAEIVSKNVHNNQKPELDIAKAMDLENEMTLKTVPKEISTQVVQARNNAKKTQEELAKLVECKVSAIKDLEAGEGAYNAELVLKVEKALAVKFTRSWKS